MATTTQGTGNGSVERFIPRTNFKNFQIKAENIIGIKKIASDIEKNIVLPTIDKIDGGEISSLMMKLSEEDLQIIVKAAEIIKNLKK
jgi:hypothetical protein